MLSSAGILTHILKAQQLDVYDIEGIYPIYTALKQGRSTVYPSVARPNSRAAAAESHSQDFAVRETVPMERAVALAAIRDYLVAATAKDCSVLLTFRRDSEATSTGQCVHVQDVTLEWKSNIIDVDRKQMTKIQAHHVLDKEIMEVARNTLDI